MIDLFTHQPTRKFVRIKKEIVNLLTSAIPLSNDETKNSITQNFFSASIFPFVVKLVASYSTSFLVLPVPDYAFEKSPKRTLYYED